MRGVSRNRSVGLFLLALSLGAFGIGALAMECAPAGGCPMMAAMQNSHCGSGVALTSSCCASMERAAEPFEIPKPGPTQLAGPDRSPNPALDPYVAPSREAAGPTESAPRALPLYSLFLAFLL